MGEPGVLGVLGVRGVGEEDCGGTMCVCVYVVHMTFRTKTTPRSFGNFRQND